MPTALELKREDLKAYREAARQRKYELLLTPSERAEREALLNRIREAAAMLRSRFGARRVVLFGSLAHEAWFDPASDVDLAVECLEGAEYWNAWREVEQLVGDRRVDLIDIDVVSESLKQAVDRYGVDV